MIPLRPYQERAVAGVQDRFRRGVRRTLLVLPTGGGKTVIASSIVGRAVDEGRPVVFLAHRRELIKQTFAKLLRNGLAPEQVGVIMAGTPSDYAHLLRPPSISEATDDELWSYYGRRRPAAPVQVGSIDTFRNRTRPRAGLVIVDEAHRALAKSYVDVQAAYPDAWHLGLTATPFRADGKGLGDAYEDLVVAATFAELVELGALVAPRCFGTPHKADLSKVRKAGGDYNQEQLARAVDRAELVGDVIDHWKRLGNDAPTFAFAVTVEHSLHLARRFNEAGIPARHVDGNTDTAERDDAVAALRAGRVKVLCNCGVFCEGTDVPAVKTIILARPTKSEGLYLQQAGRGARPFEGRPFVILDHAGACTEHGLPQEPREYTLEGRKARERKTISLPPVKECPGCYAIVPQAARRCDGCGHEFPEVEAAAKPPEEKAGELQELTPLQRSRLAEWEDVIADWRAENERREARGEPPAEPQRWCLAAWQRRTQMTWPPKGSHYPRLTPAQQTRLEDSRRPHVNRGITVHADRAPRPPATPPPLPRAALPAAAPSTARLIEVDL